MLSAAKLVAAGWARRGAPVVVSLALRPLRQQPLDFQPDRRHHALGIPQHFAIGEAQHGIAFALHPSIAPRVPFGRGIVREAVAFHHQLQRPAQEVGVVRPYRHLPAELRAELAAREVAPQNPLRRCRFPAQGPRAGGVAGCPFGHGAGVAELVHTCKRRWPTPGPSRKREGRRGRNQLPPACGRGSETC